MQNDRPVVFISYTWETNETPGHKEWVRKFADDLIEQYGINVLLDQYELSLGRPLTNFLERSIETADKVLTICTSTYKHKAINSIGGAGYEHSLISTKLYQLQVVNDKFIPILRQGTKESSIPGYLSDLVYHPMVHEDLYPIALKELAWEIWGHRKLQKPVPGPQPDFTSTSKTDPLATSTSSPKKKGNTSQKSEEAIQLQAYLRLIKAQIDYLIHEFERKAAKYRDAEILQMRICKEDDSRRHVYLLYTDIDYYVSITWSKSDTELISHSLNSLGFISMALRYTINSHISRKFPTGHFPRLDIHYYKGSDWQKKDSPPNSLWFNSNSSIESSSFYFDLDKDLVPILITEAPLKKQISLDDLVMLVINWLLDRGQDPEYLKRLAIYRQRTLDK